MPGAKAQGRRGFVLTTKSTKHAKIGPKPQAVLQEETEGTERSFSEIFLCSLRFLL
jgi:hypothetical protein